MGSLNSIGMESSKFTDLVYFGYDHYGEEADNAQKDEKEFIETLSERFPSVEFKDAYDQIKGFRREVILDGSLQDQYYSWIFAFGWHNYSLSVSLMMANIDGKDDAIKYIDLAKTEYSQNFKNEENGK
jgi:hypothetical protein